MQNARETTPIIVESLKNAWKCHKNPLGKSNDNCYCYKSTFQAHREWTLKCYQKCNVGPTNTRPNRVNRNVLFQSNDGT